MAKFVGKIGFATEKKEIEPGLYAPTFEERKYRGDLLQSTVRTETSSESVNDNIRISNQVSIVSDPYAKAHVFQMRYIDFLMPNIGGRWKISDAKIQEPRIILTLGGVYNGVKNIASEEVGKDSGD